jgi:hypothetical protein
MIHPYIRRLSPFESVFEEKCAVPYEDRGITNIEAFIWWSTVGLFRPSLILESGVYKGRSTHVLAKAQETFGVKHHFAFDRSDEHEDFVRSKLTGFQTKYKIQGSDEAFLKVLASHPDEKVVVALDGPKSGKPFEDVMRSSFGFKNLCAILVHDCGPDSGTKPLFESCCKLMGSGFEFFVTGNDEIAHLSYLNKSIQTELTKSLEGMDRLHKLEVMGCVGVCYNPLLLPQET